MIVSSIGFTNLGVTQPTAELKDGVLEITAPFAAASLPKKIEVKGTQKDKNAPETAAAAAQGKGGAK